AGDDTIYGEAGDDTIIGGDGADVVDGGDGDDVIDTSGSAPADDYGYPGVFPADTDPYDDRDTVDGGAGDDTITTGDDQDTITGGAGNDTIDGGLDDDTISGDAGDDTIIGGHGSDTIDGGAGDDVIWGGMGPGTDLFNIPDVDVPGDPFPGPDLVVDNGIDIIHGGDGNDTIYGQDDADELYGDAGDDTIDGGIDNDLIDGGAGNDTLMGGADEDTFVNLNAGDTVDGGADGVDNDTLDLTGSAEPGGSLNVTITGPDSNGNGYDGYVTYYDDMGNVTGTLNFEEIEEIIPCFTPGTMIATPRGERLVEELREGDKVITRDNGIQEIRWVGEKKMGWKDFALAEHLKPVLIEAGALGNGLPERDILVSPNHRVLVANDRTALYFEDREVLVAAKHLVDNKKVKKVDVMSTAYIHFMFDNHEVVLSNGAWTESFQPGDYSLKGIGNAQRAEIFELFPELEQVEGVEAYTSARRTLKKHEARILLK
ncbi:MAG TPA: type I secretion protein, partial [Rhodobacteraceae bacterium]|nr:type I secretion protein [Paracoccaceae bacterium]